MNMQSIHLKFVRQQEMNPAKAGSFTKVKVYNQHQHQQRATTVRWIAALLADYSIAAVAFLIAAAWGWTVYPVSILLLGIAQHRIAILGHDGAHGLICRNKKLNYWLAQVLCFWP